MVITLISIVGGFDDGTNSVRTHLKIGDKIGATSITSIKAELDKLTNRRVYYLYAGDVFLANIFDVNGAVQDAP